MISITDIDAQFPPLKNDLAVRAALRQKTERVPVWMMRQAGRYLPEFKEVRAEAEFFKVCRTPELAAKVTLQPIDRYPGLDASIIFSDIMVIPQALGLEVLMIPGKGPKVTSPLVDPSHLSRVSAPNVDAELGYVFAAIKLTRQLLNGRVPLIGFSGAPWTLMCYMVEGEGGQSANPFGKAKAWLVDHPEASHQLLKLTADVVTEYLIGQVKAGAQLLMVFDSWASLMTPESFKEFGIPYLKIIAEKVKSVAPSIPLICFAKGAEYCIDELSKLKYDCLGLDSTADPRVAREAAQGRVSLQGNLDPNALFEGREAVFEKVEEMIKKFGTQGYIANLGHGILPTHTPELVGNFIDAIHKYGSARPEELK